MPGLKSSIKVISITASHSGLVPSELTVEPSYDFGYRNSNLMFKWGLLLTPENIAFPPEALKEMSAEKRSIYSSVGYVSRN